MIRASLVPIDPMSNFPYGKVRKLHNRRSAAVDLDERYYRLEQANIQYTRGANPLSGRGVFQSPIGWQEPLQVPRRVWDEKTR